MATTNDEEKQKQQPDKTTTTTTTTSTNSNSNNNSSGSSSSSSGSSDKKTYIFKFVYRGQQFELSTLTSTDTVGDLRAVICSMLMIEDFTRITLKTLQPTKIIDPSDDTKQLSDVFRQTRERIVVEDFPESPVDLTSGGFSTPPPVQNTKQERYLQSNYLTPSTKHHKLDNELDSSEQLAPASTSRSRNPSGSSANAAQSAYMSATQSSNASTNLDGSPVRPRKTPRDQADQEPVCSSTGYLLRHPVPSNNSCLFISVHFCLTNGFVDDQIGKSMRKIIAETVASDREKYDDAFLGKSNPDYCQWILDDNNWGGAIELSILCKYYETEIVAIDVKNQILNRFGEDSQYPQRMLLLYDGLHYDPLKFQPFDENKPIQTLFPTENTEVLTLADEIAKELNQSHQYTDLKTMAMICSVCNIHLDAKSISEHVAQTGHESFREIA